MTAIHPTLAEALTRTFKVPAAELRPDATMDSLEMDSLAVAELALIVKESLGVDVEADGLYRHATLAEITDHLQHAAGVPR